LSGAFAVFVVFSPVAFTRHLGIVGVLAMGLVFLTVVATYSLGLTLKNRPSKALRLIGFRTTPIILFVLVWGVVAGQLDPGGYHDVRVISFDPEAATSALYPDADAEPSSTTGLLAVEDIGGLPFEAWLAKNCLDESPAGRGDVPMVFVSSSGGGIRAAYWTTAVLDQLTEVFDLEAEAYSPVGVDCDDPNNRLFAISGTSGGALGAATYAIQLASPSSDPDWYDDNLGGDYLSPTAAWLMVVDSPRTLFRFGSPDRAEILERSWEASNEDLESGLREFQAEHPVPLLFFNGSTVESGCRFNASVVDMGIDPPRFVFDPTNSTVHNVPPYRVPANCRAVDFVKQKRAIPAAEATSDLNDFLCDEEDMPLSTAVLLSARFPIVSPVGRISTEVKQADCKTPIEPSSDLSAAERRSLAPISTFVVDGGYIDRTGSDAIVDVYLSVLDSVNTWNATHADQDVRILPVLLQLENGYQRAEAVAAPDRPSEGMEVPQAFFSSVSGRGPASLQASIAAFSDPVVGVDPAITRYARIAPTAHPGIQAPLGWAMSSFARDDLVKQACGALGASEVAPVISLMNPLWSEQACEARSALALAGGRGEGQ
jgi:hypothetical protein